MLGGGAGKPEIYPCTKVKSAIPRIASFRYGSSAACLGCENHPQKRQCGLLRHLARRCSSKRGAAWVRFELAGAAFMQYFVSAQWQSSGESEVGSCSCRWELTAERGSTVMPILSMPTAVCASRLACASYSPLSERVPPAQCRGEEATHDGCLDGSRAASQEQHLRIESTAHQLLVVLAAHAGVRLRTTGSRLGGGGALLRRLGDARDVAERLPACLAAAAAAAGDAVPSRAGACCAPCDGTYP